MYHFSFLFTLSERYVSYLIQQVSDITQILNVMSVSSLHCRCRDGGTGEEESKILFHQGCRRHDFTPSPTQEQPGTSQQSRKQGQKRKYKWQQRQFVPPDDEFVESYDAELNARVEFTAYKYFQQFITAEMRLKPCCSIPMYQI